MTSIWKLLAGWSNQRLTDADLHGSLVDQDTIQLLDGLCGTVTPLKDDIGDSETVSVAVVGD